MKSALRPITNIPGQLPSPDNRKLAVQIVHKGSANKERQYIRTIEEKEDQMHEIVWS